MFVMLLTVRSTYIFLFDYDGLTRAKVVNVDKYYQSHIFLVLFVGLVFLYSRLLYYYHPLGFT